MNELDDLARKYNTDKSSLFHNYTEPYNFMFRERRSDVLKICEVGVMGGASVWMWRDFFRNAQIIGIDVNPDCKSLEEDRIKIRIGNQTDAGFLDGLIGEFGAFDIFIDDGGHTWFQQKFTFNYIFPHISPGGIYIIEDLSTSYLKGSVWDTAGECTVDYLKRLMDDLNLNGKSICGTLEIDNKSLNVFETWLESMFFFKGIVFIKKRKIPLQ
jgi:hypothetical protein